MSDTVCARCATPKPPCCFDFVGSDGTVCQPCHRDSEHNARARRYRKPSERAARLRHVAKVLATRPDRYADGIATLIERIEG